MAKSVSTSSRNVVMPQESAEGLKQNLRQVAEEIARVRDKAREEAESLERIRGMLDLKYLNDLIAVIDGLETRVRQMESGAAVQRYQQELENESRRLAKLWDAFKTQEDQVKALQREREELLSQLRGFERQLDGLGSPAQIRSRISKLEQERDEVQQELSINANRLEKYATLFTEEQERLAKLYRVYEDVESKYQSLVKQQKKAAPPKAAPAKGPFTVKGWTLYSRASGVKGKKGSKAKPIYFFAKKKPKSGKPSAMPAGYRVVAPKRGLPVLKKK